MKLNTKKMMSDGVSYDVSEDDDSRTQFTWEEFHSLPDRIELMHGIPRPKDWEIPQHLAALEREERELHELTKRFNGERTTAWNAYVRRIKDRRAEVGLMTIPTTTKTVYSASSRAPRLRASIRFAPKVDWIGIVKEDHE